jgi:hypothetical protein
MSEDTNTAILKEMLTWIRIQGMAQAKGVLNTALKNDKEKLVYEYSDGERGIAEIAKLTGLGFGTVQRCWSRWATMGIVEPIAVKGGNRYKKAFSLQMFGIEVPQMQGTETKETVMESGNEEDQTKLSSV